MEDMTWFPVLFRFSDGDSDGESDLVPRVIGKVVVPRLAAIVRCGWDCWSRRQTHAIVAAVQDVLQYEPSPEAKQVRSSVGICHLCAAGVSAVYLELCER